MNSYSTYETPSVSVLTIETEQICNGASTDPQQGTPGGKITEGSSVSIW